MLYRPLGHSGKALSALGLNLNWECVKNNKNALTQLIVAALENGINYYHFDYLDTELLSVACAALDSVDRKLLFISATAHSDRLKPQATNYSLIPLRDRLRRALTDSGINYFDMLLFEGAGLHNLEPESWALLDQLRTARRIRYYGLDAEDNILAAHIERGEFHIFRTSFDIDTSWDKRHLLDKAIANNISILGRDFYPSQYHNKKDLDPKQNLGFNLFKKPKNPLTGVGTYAFLHHTLDWSAEDLCLGYALTQTALTSVMIDVASIAELENLCNVPERYLPPSVPAQIEMARFSEKNTSRSA